MRCDLPWLRNGGRNGHVACVYIASAFLASAFFSITPLAAQSSPKPPPTPSTATTSSALPNAKGLSVYTYMNELADLSRDGNSNATREFTRQMFRNAGIKAAFADSFGFTDRIVQAEAAYRNGTQPPIHEADIVKSVNNLANMLGAPEWVRTNVAEVRKLRMRLLVAYPRLIAYEGPPDTNGHYKALGDNMRPIEAAYIATSLLYQKHYNTDFQFTDAEQAQNASLDAATLKAKHLERTQLFGSMLNGKSAAVSQRDLLTAATYFFDDLGYVPTGAK